MIICFSKAVCRSTKWGRIAAGIAALLTAIYLAVYLTLLAQGKLEVWKTLAAAAVGAAFILTIVRELVLRAAKT